MSHPGSRALAVGKLTAACCLLALLSCGPSPTGPAGSLLVHVSLNGNGPDPGKEIEVVGTGQVQFTDENGLAVFTLPAGNHIVRAYEIGTPGPPPPYVERGAVIEPSRTTRVEINDCAFCR